MAYHITTMTLDVYERFSQTNREKIGFLPSQRKAIAKIAAGDKLICYISGIMRWAGVLEVTSDCFIEESNVFYPEDDLLTWRFQVKPLVWLPFDSTIPLKEPRVWSKLSFATEGDDRAWIGRIRTASSELDEVDGVLMEEALTAVAESQETFPYDEKMYKRHLRLSKSNYREKVAKDDEEDNARVASPTPLRRSNRKRRLEKETVEKIKKVQTGAKRGPKPKAERLALAAENSTVPPFQPVTPEKSFVETKTLTTPYAPTMASALATEHGEDALAHYATLAKIGVAMGMQIWAPLSMRAALKKHSGLPTEYFLEHFPMFFDNTINHYLEATPLIWVKGRMLLRAFSVFDNAENLYSSLIHYADLFVLQPNLLMKTHLVSSRKNQAILTDVVQRPLFAQMAGLPLQRRCQFLAAETLQELLADKHLSFLSDSVIDQ